MEGGSIGTEFTVSRYDGLTLSERVVHSASNMANPIAKILSRRRKSSEFSSTLPPYGKRAPLSLANESVLNAEL